MQYHPAKGGKGKQHGCFYSFLDITRSEFHKIVQISRGERLLLLFRTFCHVVYATKGFTPFTLYTSDVRLARRLEFGTWLLRAMLSGVSVDLTAH
jgi:hypothetical protein